MVVTSGASVWQCHPTLPLDTQCTLQNSEVFRAPSNCNQEGGRCWREKISTDDLSVLLLRDKAAKFIYCFWDCKERCASQSVCLNNSSQDTGYLKNDAPRGCNCKRFSETCCFLCYARQGHLFVIVLSHCSLGPCKNLNRLQQCCRRKRINATFLCWVSLHLGLRRFEKWPHNMRVWVVVAGEDWVLFCFLVMVRFKHDLRERSCSVGEKFIVLAHGAFIQCQQERCGRSSL